ncbi:hypothetical protein LCGC14_2934020 [marine sediment metagenome]|uniref:Uncharacterized protein n=1 Tax=marine sediment metagenome TaxID=412755 RepID=A0A0F8ZSQ5_9ZZZZ
MADSSEYILGHLPVDENLSEEPKIRTYEIEVRCRNCHHIPLGPDRERSDGQMFGTHKGFLIPRGNTVVNVLREMECENCGCTGYMGLL